MRIAIIGAGLSGLVAAYHLRSHEVQVFDADGRIGGKLYSVPFQSGPVDLGAEAYIARSPEVQALLTDLGLDTHQVYPSTTAHSKLFVGGRQVNFPTRTIMGIPATSAAVAGLVSEETAYRIDHEEPFDWPAGGDISAGELVAQQMGEDLVTNLVDPMLGGIHSALAKDIGLRATVPYLAAVLDTMSEPRLSVAVQQVLHARGARASAAAKADKPAAVFGALRGGYAELYEALAEQSGAAIYLDSFITGVSRKGDAFTLKGVDGEFDRVLVATPAPTSAMLLTDVAPEAASLCKQIKLASSAVVALRFDSAEGLPDQSGVLVGSNEPTVHAKAFTFLSKKWPHLEERGGALVRASFGRFGDDASVRADEDDLVDWALDDLHTITGFDGRAAGASEIFVQRWFGGVPVHTKDHLDIVTKIRAALAEVPGVDATGAWGEGSGVPAVIAGAHAAAERLTA